MPCSLSRVVEGTVFNVVPRCRCPRQVWRTCAASWAARRTSIARFSRRSGASCAIMPATLSDTRRHGCAHAHPIRMSLSLARSSCPHPQHNTPPIPYPHPHTHAASRRCHRATVHAGRVPLVLSCRPLCRTHDITDARTHASYTRLYPSHGHHDPHPQHNTHPTPYPHPHTHAASRRCHRATVHSHRAAPGRRGVRAELQSPGPAHRHRYVKVRPPGTEHGHMKVPAVAQRLLIRVVGTVGCASAPRVCECHMAGPTLLPLPCLPSPQGAHWCTCTCGTLTRLTCITLTLRRAPLVAAKPSTWT